MIPNLAMLLQGRNPTPDFQFPPIPARVLVAMRLLSEFGQRTAAKVAGNESGFYDMPRDELSVGEIGAREAAGDLLRAYLEGRLKPVAGEAECQVDATTTKPPGKGMPCVLCLQSGTVSAECGLCAGTGFIRVCAGLE